MSEVKKNLSPDVFVGAALALFANPQITLKFKKYLKPEYFERVLPTSKEYKTQPLSTIMEVWLNLVEDEKSPTITCLWARIGGLPDGDLRDEALDFLADLRNNEDWHRLSRSKETLSVFKEWLKRRAFAVNFDEIKNLSKSSMDEFFEGLMAASIEIQSVLSENEDVCTIEWDNAVEVLEAQSEQQVNKFKLGISDFDLDVGFELQTLNLFVAATGTGKTMTSIHLIKQAIEQNKNVYSIFLEDRQDTIYRRLYAALTGFTIDEIKNIKHMSPQKIKQLREVNQLCKRYVTVEFAQEMAPETVFRRIADVNATRKVKGEPKNEIIIMDYLQHISHYGRGDSSHEKLANAMARAKDFALKHEVCMFTHQQVNRTGSITSSKDGLITMGDLSTSFNASFVCDVIISINRTPELQKQNKSVFYVIKGREGASERKYEVKTKFECAQYLMGESLRLDKLV